MSTSVAVIAGCTVVTAVIKAAGPVALGGRELPSWVAAIVVLLAPALLAALVVTSIFADGQKLAVGPETAGALAGCAVAWRTGSVVGCVVVAAALTAVLRAMT